jgi:hypothetical protein
MVTYSLEQSAEGHWSVCRAGFSLFNDLRLESAIKLAREVAREEYLSSGRAVCVEMPGPESTIRLAKYSRPAAPVISAT